MCVAAGGGGGGGGGSAQDTGHRTRAIGSKAGCPSMSSESRTLVPKIRYAQPSRENSTRQLTRGSADFPVGSTARQAPPWGGGLSAVLRQRLRGSGSGHPSKPKGPADAGPRRCQCARPSLSCSCLSVYRNPCNLFFRCIFLQKENTRILFGTRFCLESGRHVTIWHNAFRWPISLAFTYAAKYCFRILMNFRSFSFRRHQIQKHTQPFDSRILHPFI